jgi:hypothetical protein
MVTFPFSRVLLDWLVINDQNCLIESGPPCTKGLRKQNFSCILFVRTYSAPFFSKRHPKAINCALQPTRTQAELSRYSDRTRDGWQSDRSSSPGRSNIFLRPMRSGRVPKPTQSHIHCVLGTTDHLCGLVVRVPGDRTGFDSRRYHIFWKVDGWNGVHSASWVQLKSYLKEKVAASV